MTFQISAGTEYRNMSPAQRAEQEELAALFIKALQELTADPVKLEVFKSYISRHFFSWYEKYAGDPYDMTYEIKRFSEH